MESILVVLLVVAVGVLLALALAWVPARMILLAIGKSAGERVREFIRRSRDRRRRPRGTPDRRD